LTSESGYVLGTDDEEVARLGLQHAVWRPRATAAWQRAGFSRGQTIVDLGCGPGYATLDLAEIVGPEGRVVAIDQSRRFLDVLRARVRALALRHVEVLELNLDEAPLPRLSADGIWTRWVYSFVRGPGRLLERAVRLLKPGGTIVMHEYADYGAWQTSPRSAEFERFVAEVMKSWRDAGGEPDIARELPRWLEELGCEVRSLSPLVEAARPGDHFWEWPTAFVASGTRRLVELGRMSEAEAQAVVGAYRVSSRAAGAFQLTPTVLEIIAVSRGGDRT